MNELYKTEVEMTKEETTEEIRYYCQDSEKIIKASERELKTILVPDNATNGDMIKALFPNITVVDNCWGFYSVDLEDLSEDRALNSVGLRKEWWNAPYKSEVSKDADSD